MQPSSILLALVGLLAPAYQPALAQCAEFDAGFGALGVAGPTAVASRVHAQIVFDDGSGDALIVGGDFDSAGDVAAPCIAKWDGQAWSPLGTPSLVPATSSVRGVNALASFDSGAGPELYAGGAFNGIGGVGASNIAKWNGVNWSPVGSGLAQYVSSFAVFDDGSGAKLYATCGTGGLNPLLARWDGATWTNVSPVSAGALLALAVYDDGSGPALYLGGSGLYVGSTPKTQLWRLFGGAWSEIGGPITLNGFNGSASALKTFDDGTGLQLYVGGSFDSVGGVPANNIARWNGASWSALGPGVSTGGLVRALETYDDGTGPALYASGTFAAVGGANCGRIARWKNNAWSVLGSPAGVDVALGSSVREVNSLAVFDDGAGAKLFAGGVFGQAGGGRADSIACWDGSNWATLGATSGFDLAVSAMGAFDSGAGAQIFASGSFRYAGDVEISGLAQFDGAHWSQTPINSVVSTFETLDTGAGPRLYAGGGFISIGGVAASSIASWDGAQWSAVGAGANGWVRALTVFDDGSGPALWAGGDFTVIGGAPAKHIARWNGAAWTAPAIGPASSVFALAAYDDGSGPALYAGGNFLKVGTQNVFGIARFDGANWSPVGNGFNMGVNALEVFDDGAGPQLYATGNFTSAPPFAAAGVARWDGVFWRPLGAGLGAPASGVALEVFDDGAGSALYVGGSFTNGGGASIRHLARWKDGAWSQPAGVVNGSVLTLASLHHGPAPGRALYVGGNFNAIGAVGSSRIARFSRRCTCPPQSYCTAGVSTNGCAPTMSSVGTPSASSNGSFVLSANDVEGQKLGLLFYGTSGRASTPWGATSSVLCVRPPQQRMVQLQTGGTQGVCDGLLSTDWNAYVASHPGALGAPFQAGELVQAQGWYRDPANSKTTSLTNAIEFMICP